MAVEKYIAIAGLGLFVMFVGEILTLYNFMIDAPLEVEPDPKLLQFISIGVSPALVMSGVSFIMSRRYGNKQVGILIVSGGAVLLVGMAAAYTFLDKIQPEYLTDTVKLVPPLFMAVSIPVMIVGSRLFKIKERKSKKDDYVE